MDQQTLRELESRCIQEEPPPCTAACPLHVDVRGFVGHMGSGRWAQALGLLHKTMPLSGILGRICDAPCQDACNRKNTGGSIRIGDLEYACMEHGQAQRRVMPLPKKEIRVAVMGSGLSSLTVAWDLARKGYDLTVYEPRSTVGEKLMQAFPRRLSEAIITREIALLKQLEVRFETSVEISDTSRNRYLEDFDALYVGLDAVPGVTWGIDSSAEDNHEPWPGATGRKGLFAGGGHASPVWQAASGRWCATSMDRWLQNVSMSAGRDKEGPFASRLFTDLDQVESLPAVPMADPETGFSADEVLQEARRCLQCECLECVKACTYLQQFGGYPRKYAREIYNNEAIVMGERKANRLINSCSLCGLCEIVCLHDFAMQDLCLAARQSMVEREKMPPSAHEFALQDMAFSQSDAFAMARHAPGHTHSADLFFPGCQLAASDPQQVTQVYAFLREQYNPATALMLDCCGAPAHWAGQKDLFAQTLEAWQATWEDMGRPRPILACATCLRMFKDHLPQTNPVSLWEILDQTHIPKQAGGFAEDGPLAIHDPCTSRHEPAVQAAVRRLLSQAAIPTEELALGRERTECCGFGGLMQNANAPLADAVVETRGQRSPNDYVAYCAMCRDNLVRLGKRTLHLLDLLFPDPALPDPAARPWPGWSRRRENRQRLKADLLSRLWGEASPPEADPADTLRLIMDPEVAARLDVRRILETDVRRTIAQAEKEGTRFRHAETGQYLAAYRSAHATFWVIYAPQDGGLRVHNAYAHRMEVLGP